MDKAQNATGTASLDKCTLRCKVSAVRSHSSQLARVAVGAIAGAVISAVDNFAFGGEVSPIVIVAMLLGFAGATGAIWGVRAGFVTAIAWTWLPGIHLLKHLFGLPDTIHPNTCASILKLATFSLTVVAVGLATGLLFRGLRLTESVEP